VIWRIRAGYRLSRDYEALGRKVAERFDPECEIQHVIVTRRADSVGSTLSLDIESVVGRLTRVKP
jgi:hypothetical protein